MNTNESMQTINIKQPQEAKHTAEQSQVAIKSLIDDISSILGCGDNDSERTI